MRAGGGRTGGEDRSLKARWVARKRTPSMAVMKAAEPAAGVRDRVAADTEPRGVGVSWIGHLEKADGAGGGPVDREGIKTPSPAPVGARHRIARTLDLRQRGQQFGRDRRGG